jgi:site-specific DNA-methyltransferase (adenine-specific)
MIELLNIDCMEYMKGVPDKYFDLAIVDPPYGIGANKMQLGNGKHKINRGSNDWDNESPDLIYFSELQRISENQIIWGGNYFANKIPISRGWIVWDKGTGDNDYADGELAWTSFDRVLKIFKKTWVGANAKNESNRIHPTEKPVQLYKWLLKNYAKPEFKIIDTHGGSMSSVIACYDFGITEMVCCEIDKDYFDAGCARFENFKAQLKLF